MTQPSMRPLERLAKEHWESHPEGPEDWAILKQSDPEIAEQAFEQMRATVRCLAPWICSPSDRLWLIRIAECEELFQT